LTWLSDFFIRILSTLIGRFEKIRRGVVWAIFRDRNFQRILSDSRFLALTVDELTRAFRIESVAEREDLLGKLLDTDYARDLLAKKRSFVHLIFDHPDAVEFLLTHGGIVPRALRDERFVRLAAKDSVFVADICRIPEASAALAADQEACDNLVEEPAFLDQVVTKQDVIARCVESPDAYPFIVQDADLIARLVEEESVNRVIIRNFDKVAELLRRIQLDAQDLSRIIEAPALREQLTQRINNGKDMPMAGKAVNEFIPDE
jgi:hypothetical protein